MNKRRRFLECNQASTVVLWILINDTVAIASTRAGLVIRTNARQVGKKGSGYALTVRAIVVNETFKASARTTFANLDIFKTIRGVRQRTRPSSPRPCRVEQPHLHGEAQARQEQ